MINLNKIFFNIIPVIGLSFLSGQVLADPPILPPGTTAPPVSCFILTDANHLGSGIQVQFEILNWTDEDANDFHVSLNTDPLITTGGTLGSTPNPVAGPFQGKVNSNDWIVSASTPTSTSWVGGSSLAFIDLDPNNDGNYIDAPILANPLDSGANVLDGFVLNLPDFDIHERIVLDWVLTKDGLRIIDDNGGFSFGTFQLDRALNGQNGEVRLSAFFGIGQTSSQISNFQPLDIELTEQNAIAVSNVPVPAAVWLFASAIIGLFSVNRRRVI